MYKKIIRYINDPKLIILYMLYHKIGRILPDKAYLRIIYRLIMNKKLSLENPKTFNEKLQWLKLYDKNPLYTNLVDKYQVRKYVAEKIGEEYLIPLYGVWDKFEDIDFNELPNQFVLKPNHTSGNIFICRDKSAIDMKKLKKEVNKWLKIQYYWLYREWPYKNIKPKILCEKYLVDKSGVELKDYKFMCFNGKVKCLFVCSDRFTKTGLKVNFYDVNWKPLPFERHYPKSSSIIPKPKNFKKMIELSEILSNSFPFVRVDFYEVDGKLYFGELTFYPGSGLEEFSPEIYDYKLGCWINLPNNYNS